MSNEIHNPDVELTGWRKIAVRGLIPGHEGSEIVISRERNGAAGVLKRFYHRSDGYTEVVLTDGWSTALPHLFEIEIKS